MKFNFVRYKRSDLCGKILRRRIKNSLNSALKRKQTTKFGDTVNNNPRKTNDSRTHQMKRKPAIKVIKVPSNYSGVGKSAEFSTLSGKQFDSTLPAASPDRAVRARYRSPARLSQRKSNICFIFFLVSRQTVFKFMTLDSSSGEARGVQPEMDARPSRRRAKYISLFTGP
ncbi:hypothetical protein EVAR_51283_1 [Eumeta japonica]|uniref:Uncharacterized protein n=1 Tax=Eumeta variegata TaxID=151549 RepID=A0A4C1XU64_EUMVA|nr:hypothetical protein EVAR_51283_1 [Eumeta japonica]